MNGGDSFRYSDRDEPPAIGVEECIDCGEGWEGLSCQNPAGGFFRQFTSNRFDHPDDLVLIGMAQPCACHGHSTNCERETGHCLVRE